MATTQKPPESPQAAPPNTENAVVLGPDGQSARPLSPQTRTRDADSTAATLEVAWWKWATGLLMAYVCYGAFFVAGGAEGFAGGKSGESARIIFFHVPVAILS